MSTKFVTTFGGHHVSAITGTVGALARLPRAAFRSHGRGRLVTASAVVLTAGVGLGVLSSMAASASTQATAAAGTNCAVLPSACGYPDATNTGVPAGTTLQNVPGQVSSGPGWHFDPRGWVQVTGSGAVLSGLNIPYNINVTGNNVTIQNDRIAVGGNTFGVSLRHTSNVTVANNTITGLGPGSGRLMVGVRDIYGDSTGLRVQANNIMYADTGIKMESGLIAGNYIHDMGYIPGDHINGISSNGGVTAALTIQHNTILNQLSQTDAIGLFQDFGVQANRVIDNNLLAGGGFALYGGMGNQGQPSYNIQVTNNRFSTLYYPNSGKYGPAAFFNSSAPGDTWSGNVWDNNGQPVAHP